MPATLAYRVVSARPRLTLAAGVGLAIGLLWSATPTVRPITRWIVAWNVGAWLYLLLIARLITSSSIEGIQQRAKAQDAGSRLILTLVAIASLTSLGAIVAELSHARDLEGANRILHIGLALATLASSWLFTQVMFALHYAHDYYVAVSNCQPGGLTFPDTQRPTYIDFLYFSIVIGTSGQTADVSFSSTAMRRIGMLHCTLAFVFNTSLVGLMINVASGLI